MTLGGRTIVLPLLAAGLVLALLLFFLADFSIVGVINVVPALALAALIFRHLYLAGYSLAAALPLTACLFAIPDFAMLFRVDGPVWLSLMMLGVVMGATAAVERMDTRGIVILGLSLALVQAVDPIGVFLVVLIIPLLMAVPHLRANGYRAFALAMYVLFIPLMSAFTLSRIGAQYLSAVPPLPMLMLALGAHVQPHTVAPAAAPFALVSAAAFAIPVFLVPAIQRSLRDSAGTLAVLLGLAAIAAFVTAEILGARREAYWLAGALLPVIAVTLGALRPSALRERIAVPAAVLGLASSWAVWSL